MATSKEKRESEDLDIWSRHHAQLHDYYRALAAVPSEQVEAFVNRHRKKLPPRSLSLEREPSPAPAPNS